MTIYLILLDGEPAGLQWCGAFHYLQNHCVIGQIVVEGTPEDLTTDQTIRKEWLEV